MWDVIWTDPGKELVGEHRAKKVRAKDGNEQSSSLRSGRDSSATSGSNSSSEGAFSFFRSRRGKNVVAPRSSGNRSPSFSGLATPSLTSTLSPFSQTFDSSSRRSSGMVTTAPNSPNKDGLDVFSSGCEHDTLPSFDAESIHSGAVPLPLRFSEAETSDSPSIAALIQLLDDLPPRTELPDVPKAEAHESENVAKATNVLAGAPSIDALIATPPKSPSKGTGVIDTLGIPDVPESPILLTPPPKSSRRPVGSPLGIHDPNSWRTPSQWRDDETKEVQKSLEPIDLEADANANTRIKKSLAASDAEQGFLSAAGAPTAMILAKVKQFLAAKPAQKLEQGLQGPKQHWMLSLLLDSGQLTDPNVGEEKYKTAASAAAPVMLLYETAVYASYIGIQNRDAQVYHLTREKMPSNWKDNIQTLQAPLFEAPCFSVSSQFFQTVHSFSLPANCPYTTLQNILGNVHKCLKPGGSFKVAIIDPLPYADSCGQRLRDWMEKHLFPNLEKSSRCLEPSRFFPRLLGDANLRGPGSRRRKIKFFALEDNARCGDYHDPDPSINRMRRELAEKAELRTLIGRMYWMEVWGQHVTPPNTWWWEDAACVEECRELGTFWEYHVINAVKP